MGHETRLRDQNYTGQRLSKEEEILKQSLYQLSGQSAIAGQTSLLKGDLCPVGDSWGERPLMRCEKLITTWFDISWLAQLTAASTVLIKLICLGNCQRGI